MYESSCEIIYNMISSRIRERKKALNLNNSEICPPADSSLISAILNNRRNDKKNKYLIPDGVKANYISKNDIPFVDIIASNLSYKNTTELLIGTPEELKAYSGHLFYQLLTDAIRDESKDVSSTIENLLSDYIPYAEASTYYKIQEEYGYLTQFVIDEEHQFNNDKYEELRKTAIARFYNLIKFDFKRLFECFFKAQPNTLKLNKRLSLFVTNEVMPCMSHNRKDNIIINDVNVMLEKIYDATATQITHEISIPPEVSDHYEYITSYYDKNIFPEWASAVYGFIDALKNIQKENEPSPNLSLLENHWNPNMCLKPLS